MKSSKKKKINFYSPLRYPGGKSCIFKFVSALIIENGYFKKKYAEPYAGGSGLALKLLFEDIVDEIYLNDFDYNIYSFWYAILNDTEIFCKWIENLEINIENWYYYKNIISNHSEFNYLEIGKAIFFLNRTNISGVIKGGIIGGKKQSGKYKLDARFNKDDLINRIKLISTKKDKIHLTNLDALKFIEYINKIDETFIYFDPPYFLKGSELYMNYYNKNDHTSLSDKIKTLKHHFIISYDNTLYIKELYMDYTIYKFNISQSTSNKTGNEIIIFPYNINFSKSIEYLKNPILELT